MSDDEFHSGDTQPSMSVIPSLPPLSVSRKSWPAYFIAIAHAVSTRATCDRKHVGCIITRDNRIVVTGYNGSVPGAPHCDDVGHDMANVGADGKGGNCVRTVHAEANAVAQAARFGLGLEGTTAFINTFPCWPCFKLLASAGVKMVVFDDDYREDPRVRDGAQDAGVAIIKFLK